MGCDIHGYVEVRKYDFGTWYDCVNIKSIVGRNYDMFALLFGVRNDAAFIPIAPDRGMPALVSDQVKKDVEEWGEDGHSLSWITWKEIQAINWNEQGTQLADRIFFYRPGEERHYQSVGSASYISDTNVALLNRGETIELIDPFTNQRALCRREVQKTSDAISSDWQCLFDLMKQLDEYYRRDEKQVIESSRVPVPANQIEDDNRVRLVVWFDN